MAWIRVINEEEAEGRLADNYRKLTAPWGGVDNILKIHSLSPASLEVHYDFYRTLMRSSKELPKAKREMIATVVSQINHCVY